MKNLPPATPNIPERMGTVQILHKEIMAAQVVERFSLFRMWILLLLLGLGIFATVYGS